MAYNSTIDKATDDILIYGNTAKDGSGTSYVPLLDTDGHQQVDVLSAPAPLSTTGGGTEATALRVTVASDSTGVLSVDDNGGSLTVDGTVSITANSAVNVAQINGATPALANVTPTSTLTGYQNIIPGAVYNATPTTRTEGQWGTLQSDTGGLLLVKARINDGNGNNISQQTPGDSMAAAATTALGVTNFSTVYNGTNYQRQRTVIDGTNSTGTGIAAAGILAQFDDTTPTSITENQFGNLRMSANRNLYGTIRDAAGNERGANVTAANALVVDASGTAVPVTDNSGSLTVDNAGTFAVQESGAALTSLQLIDDGIATVASAITTKGMAAVGTDGTNARILKTDTSGELQVDIVGALPAGTNAIGKLAANSGVDIGDVDVTSVTPGTTATSLGKAEDAGHTTGDTGVYVLGVRNDTPNTALTNTDADYASITTDRVGGVRTALYETDFAVLGTNHVKKYYTNAGAVTDGIVWSPAAGKRWYVTDIFINVSAAATVTLEDDLGAGDSPVWKAELAANSGWSHHFGTPLFSGEDAADLLVTTTAGNVYITVTGYEV